MATTIQVEIEHRRYVDLCVARRGERGQLNITTIEPGQQQALIKLFAAHGDRRTPLQTVEARGLPSDPERHIPMQLTSAVVSGGKLRVRLYVEGVLFLERFVPVGRFLGLPRSLIIALSGLLVFALIVVAGSLVRSCAVSEPDEMDSAEELTETPGQNGAAEADPDDQSDGAADDAPTDPDDQSAGGSDDEPTDPDDQSDGESDDEPTETDDQSAGESDDELPETDNSSAQPDDDEEPGVVEPSTYIVRFNPESARLRADTRDRLDEIATEVAEHDLLLRIDGHTAIAGSEEGRQRLSERRATRVRDYLRNAGVSSERISGIRSLGATEPITEDPDRQDANRRVEIVEREE